MLTLILCHAMPTRQNDSRLQSPFTELHSVIATGPSSKPLSWTHVVPVISPLPFNVNQAANTGS